MPRILVIDDSAFSRKQLTKTLAQDHEVIQATDGQEGLEAARAEKPDCIFTDMLMPNMDGITFLKALRQEP